MTYRVEAEAFGPGVFARVYADLTAPDPVANVDDLSPEEKRALMKAERKRLAAIRGARTVGR